MCIESEYRVANCPNCQQKHQVRFTEEIVGGEKKVFVETKLLRQPKVSRQELSGNSCSDCEAPMEFREGCEYCTNGACQNVKCG